MVDKVISILPTDAQEQFGTSDVLNVAHRTELRSLEFPLKVLH